eukprot:5975572-Amphidinium_carterae.1
MAAMKRTRSPSRERSRSRRRRRSRSRSGSDGGRSPRGGGHVQRLAAKRPGELTKQGLALMRDQLPPQHEMYGFPAEGLPAIVQ